MASNSSAFCSIKVRRFPLFHGVFNDRFSPSLNISPLISVIVIFDSTSPWTRAACSKIRNAMSPVPPATSKSSEVRRQVSYPDPTWKRNGPSINGEHPWTWHHSCNRSLLQHWKTHREPAFLYPVQQQF